MSGQQKRSAILGGLLFLLVVGAYVPSLSCGYVWDDDNYVTANPLIVSAGGLGRIWLEPTASPQYYPLVFTTFWIEHAVWGLNAAGYHFVNIALHAISALLLWRLLRSLGMPGAWLAAAIFALHPIQVESVAWITERKNVLSGVFYFAALLAYQRFQRINNCADATAQQEPRLSNTPLVDQHSSVDWRFWAISFLFFIAALLSKSVTSTLPGAILVLVWWKRGRLRWSDVVPLIPFFAIGICSGLFTSHLEQEHVGAGNVPDLQLSTVARCLVAGRAVWFYAWKLAWPAAFTFSYPRWVIDTGASWQYLFPLSALALLIALWAMRHRIGRSPIAAALYFGGTLFPALGFVSVYPMRFSFVADHFAYLACIGPIALAAAGVVRLSRTIRARSGYADCPGLSFPHLFFVGLIVIGLSVMTWRQCGAYRDAETLWKDTVTKNPSSWMAYGNLAKVIFDKGRVAESVEYSKKALALKWNAPHIHQNLGWAYFQLGKYDEAIACYQEGLRQLPKFTRCRINLALALLARHEPQKAIEILQAAPPDADVEYQLGLILSSQKRTDEAILQYREAVQLRPEFAEAWNDLGNLLAARGESDEALHCFTEAVKAKEGFSKAHNNLAVMLSGRGRATEAIEHLKRAVALDRNYAEARFNLASLLAGSGRYAEAAVQFEEVLRINPADAGAKQGLMAARLQVNRAATQPGKP